MTWAGTIATGRGELSYRLVIERLPTQFVTHPTMIAEGRIGGLKVNGKLKCQGNPIAGGVEVSGLTCEIVDLDHAATAIFAKGPDHATWLTAAITHNSTGPLTVRSTAGFPSSGTLWLDSEAIDYSGIGSGTTFTGLTRGAYGSLGQAHYLGTDEATRYPEVTSSIVSIGGCRARLYAYGQNDDPQGDGTQIWLGVVTKHPSLSGPAWSLMIDPITSVLNKTLAADLQTPSRPRGAKYDWLNRHRIVFRRADTGGTLRVEFPASLTDQAFFENNDEFASYWNAKAAARITAAGWDVSIGAQLRIIPQGDDGYIIGVTSDSTLITVSENSGPIDPQFGANPSNIDGSVASPINDGQQYYFVGDSSSVPGAGSIPRGYLGPPIATGLSDLEEAFPLSQLFVSGAAINSSVDVVAGSWKAMWFYPEIETTLEVRSTDAATNSIQLESDIVPGSTLPAFRSHAWTAASIPELRFGRTYSSEANLFAALFNIVILVPTLLNKGAVPDLRAGDFDESWQLLDTDPQPRIVASRRFTSFTDAELLEVVKGDLLLAGYMLGTSSNGRMAIAKIRNVVDTEAVDFSLTDVIDVPTWEPSAFGMVNQVLIRRGYNALEDEYDAPPVLVRDAAQFGRNPRPRTANIEPKSIPAGAVESYAECVEVAQRIFSAYGGPYAIVTVKTPLTAYVDATVGAVVSITSPHLPDYEFGTMGVEDKRAMVIGREVDLKRGEVTLRLYMPTNRGGGYAPGSRITAESVVSGNTWDVTLSADYMPDGTAAADWFLAGDYVIARLWDSTTSTTISGQVTSSTGNVVRVAFASSAAGLTAGDWYLTARVGDGSLSDTQERYAFLGDSEMSVDFVTGARAARRFS